MTPSELGALVVFLPVRLVNSLNEREWWRPRATRTTRQRQALAVVILAELRRRRLAIAAEPEQPKRIEFHAFVAQAFDDDNLRAAVKPIRDGLIDCGLIDDDGPTTGHVFEYTQTPRTPRPQRGVRIRITLRDREAPSDG